ncbi:MAG: peptidoglycan-associated lipoprotein Pal [Candidatus Eisenbacteria bacterium]|nr:peptidoglycan-associated lipoprotein Pal [Candidatus Eisenbacteria bacterium]
MKFLSHSLRLLPMLALAFVIAGSVDCSKKPKPTTDVTTSAPTQPSTPPPPPPTETQPVETPREATLNDIFFDYDKSNLTSDARQTMQGNAETMASNKDLRVQIEGHCDERGTVEYNLALGERRAQAAKGYLVDYGIDPGRISTVSYGEERPFAQGHDESAWAQNRRAHFVIQK